MCPKHHAMEVYCNGGNGSNVGTKCFYILAILARVQLHLFLDKKMTGTRSRWWKKNLIARCLLYRFPDHCSFFSKKKNRTCMYIPWELVCLGNHKKKLQNFSNWQLGKLHFSSTHRYYVIPVNVYPVVTIRPVHLVPETDRVSQFVDYNSQVPAALSKW